MIMKTFWLKIAGFGFLSMVFFITFKLLAPEAKIIQPAAEQILKPKQSVAPEKNSPLGKVAGELQRNGLKLRNQKEYAGKAGLPELGKPKVKRSRQFRRNIPRQHLIKDRLNDRQI